MKIKKIIALTLCILSFNSKTFAITQAEDAYLKENQWDFLK